MSRQPEAFGLDRLPTPIGTALLVSDADGVLRALDWEDHEPRMRDLLRLQYGAVELKDAQASAETRAALTGYFKGDLDRLNDIRWGIAGTPFQRKVWKALPGIPPGATMSYGVLAAKIGMPRAVARSATPTAPTRSASSYLPSPDRRQWFAGQVWRRAGAEALAAGT